MSLGSAILTTEGIVLEATGGVFLRWYWDHKRGTQTLRVDTTPDLAMASTNPDAHTTRELGRLGQAVVRRHRVKVERVVRILAPAELALEPSPPQPSFDPSVGRCEECGHGSCNGECL